MMDRQPPMTHLVKNARLRLTQTQTDTRQTQVNLPKVFVCLDPEGYLLRRLLSCLSVSSLETGMTWYDTSRSARDDRQISLSATNRTLKVTLKLSLISLSSRSTAKEKKTSVLGKEGSFYGWWLDMRFADWIATKTVIPASFSSSSFHFRFFWCFKQIAITIDLEVEGKLSWLLQTKIWSEMEEKGRKEERKKGKEALIWLWFFSITDIRTEKVRQFERQALSLHPLSLPSVV